MNAASGPVPAIITVLPASAGSKHVLWSLQRCRWRNPITGIAGYRARAISGHGFGRQAMFGQADQFLSKNSVVWLRVKHRGEQSL
jgi:hypothetical protein